MSLNSLKKDSNIFFYQQYGLNETIFLKIIYSVKRLYTRLKKRPMFYSII